MNRYQQSNENKNRKISKATINTKESSNVIKYFILRKIIEESKHCDAKYKKIKQRDENTRQKMQLQAF